MERIKKNRLVQKICSLMERIGSSRFGRFMKYLWAEHSIIIVFVIIFSICIILAPPRFFTFNNMMTILRNASIIGVIALGITLVIITGGIDLSAGHVVAVSGSILILLQGRGDVPLIVAILACFAVATFVGFVNGFIVTKFKVPPFIVTLAIGTIARSLTMFFLQGRTVSGRNVPEFTQIGSGSSYVIPGVLSLPNALIIWIASAIILGCILAYTKFGSYIYAVGGNENAARYSGINVDRIRILAYTITGFMVGIAALLDMSRMASVSPPTSGLGFEFDAITAAVVGGAALSGGKGRIYGTVLGMILIALVSNLMIMMEMSPFLSGTVKGVIILLAVLLQRKG